MWRDDWKYVLLEGDPDVPGGAIPIGEPEVDPYEGLSVKDFIPTEFEGRDPAEVKVLLSQMPRIVKNQKDEIDNIRLQMAGAGAPTVTHGHPTPAAPVKTAEEAQREFEELFDKDPRAAIKAFIAEEYAPTLEGMESRLGHTDLTLIKQANPDFADYEEDVKGLLTQSNAPATQQNIMGAYAMAVGNRELQRKAVIARGAETTPVTPAAPDPAAATPALDGLQTEVAGAMGLSPEEFAKYSAPDSFDLKIRT